MSASRRGRQKQSIAILRGSEPSRKHPIVYNLSIGSDPNKMHSDHEYDGRLQGWDVFIPTAFRYEGSFRGTIYVGQVCLALHARVSASVYCFSLRADV